MLPTTSQAPPRPDLRGNMYTITLNARSEFSDNVDNLKVASILGHDNYGAYVCSFVFNTDSLGCAWLVIKFGTKQCLAGMFDAVAAFLKEVCRLNDCHRIVQTMNFLDDYDGNWDGSPEERASDIIRRLPEKLQTEARDTVTP